MKQKKKKKKTNTELTKVFLARDNDGDYSIFNQEPFYDWEGEFWQGKGLIFHGIDEAQAKRLLRFNRHLLKGDKGITPALLGLQFKKLKGKLRKRSSHIFNKPI